MLRTKPKHTQCQLRRGFRSRAAAGAFSALVDSSGAGATSALVSERFAREVRAARSSTPDPKSSSDTGAAASGSAEAVRRVRVEAARGRAVVLRVDGRRRGLSLVPSGSELLVGIKL